MAIRTGQWSRNDVRRLCWDCRTNNAIRRPESSGNSGPDENRAGHNVRAHDRDFTWAFREHRISTTFRYITKCIFNNSFKTHIFRTE